MLRVSATALGIFAAALIVVGFFLTALIAFAVRNPFFQVDNIILPTLTACALGLLTILYDFVVSKRYSWNTPALLVTIAAAVSTFIYAILFILTRHRITALTSLGERIPMQTDGIPSSVNTAWQEPGYYENYVRNMFPSSVHQAPAAAASMAPLHSPMGYDSPSLTEDEMQRQQMLMLLLKRDEPTTTSDASSSTFHIDWEQGQDPDETLPPQHGGFYTHSHSPHSQYSSTKSAYTRQGLIRQLKNQALPPWDGVLRGPAPVSRQGRSPNDDTGTRRVANREWREERRREIEQGG